MPNDTHKCAYLGLLKRGNFKLYASKDIKVSKELDFDIKSSQNTSLEHFCAALLSAICLALKEHFRRENIALNECEGKIKLEVINPLSYLGVIGYDEECKIVSIDICVHLSFDGQISSLDEFCFKALKKCILFQSFKDKINIAFLEVL